MLTSSRVCTRLEESRRRRAHCVNHSPVMSKTRYLGSEANVIYRTLCLRLHASSNELLFRSVGSPSPPRSSHSGPYLSQDIGGVRWDVLTEPSTFPLHHSGIIIVFYVASSILDASWVSATLQLATLMAPIHLSSTPYIRVRGLNTF